MKNIRVKTKLLLMAFITFVGLMILGGVAIIKLVTVRVDATEIL